jgi:hypothetical protein
VGTKTVRRDERRVMGDIHPGFEIVDY